MIHGRTVTSQLSLSSILLMAGDYTRGDGADSFFREGWEQTIGDEFTLSCCLPRSVIDSFALISMKTASMVERG